MESYDLFMFVWTETFTPAAPAPFLTEENAVNTKGRRGGMVNQSDSLIEAGEVFYITSHNSHTCKYIHSSQLDSILTLG